jgi:Domain of unknown function (DUF3395)
MHRLLALASCLFFASQAVPQSNPPLQKGSREAMSAIARWHNSNMAAPKPPAPNNAKPQEESTPPKSAAAKKAKASYEAELDKLDREMARRQADLRHQYLRDLDDALKQALAGDDLDEAQRIVTAKRAADAGEPTTKAATPQAGFAVLFALFGTESQWADVTRLVRGRVRSSRLSIMVPYHGATLQQMGFPDPAPNKAKALVVVYANAGSVGAAVVGPEERLELPPRKAP